MGLDTNQSTIRKRCSTLRIAVRASATDGERMEAVGMDACRGRDRLQSLLQKPRLNTRQPQLIFFLSNLTTLNKLNLLQEGLPRD